jgi:hypothetical protein
VRRFGRLPALSQHESGRRAFDVSTWAKEKGLKLVGANYMEAYPPGEER